MNYVNVIVTQADNGIIDNNILFFDAGKAEQHFAEICETDDRFSYSWNALTPDEKADVLDDGYFETPNFVVMLSWPEILTPVA